MAEIKNVLLYIRNIRNYILLVSITLICAALFEFAFLFEPYFKIITGAATYLTWHNMFEFVAILVSFAIFIVQYFTYDQTKRLRALFLANVFLSTGIIEAFHTLSFKGMPAFFVENISANRSTTYWIILSLFSSVGLLMGILIPINKKAHYNKKVFLSITLIMCLCVFIIATYYPRLLPKMYIEGIGLTPTKIILERGISLIFALTAISLIIDYKKNRDYQTIIFACGVIFRIFAGYAFIRYEKVDDVYNFIGHIFLILAYFMFFRVAFVYNIQQPYLNLAKAEKELKEHARNLDKAVNERTIELKKLNQNLLNDLEYARDIQRAMLPKELPNEQGISFYAQYFPVECVGGDFYNIFKLDENNFAMYIGDVSGHGVSAAMLTVFINQSIATIRETTDNGIDIIMPSMVLKKVYEEFNTINFKDDVYLVMLYAIYNTKTMKLTYSSAGMNVPPLLIAYKGLSSEIDINGFPICKFSEFYSANYVDSEIELRNGDKILFYTDGLTEAEGGNAERFSEERLIKIADDNSILSGKLLGETLTNEFFSFIDSKKLKDDITFFIMQVG